MVTRCQHQDFVIAGTMDRLMSPSGETTLAHVAIISIRCSACGVAFRFNNLPRLDDSDQFSAGVTVDGTELHVPVEPAYNEEVDGIPTVCGHA